MERVSQMHGSNAQSVARLEALAKLMDGAFVIPGTNIRMGLDGLIGLVPVAGDMVSGLISTYMIWEARQLGAPRWLIARMLPTRCSTPRSARSRCSAMRSTCCSGPI